MDMTDALTIFALQTGLAGFSQLALFVKRSANLAGLSGTLFGLWHNLVNDELI